MKTYTAEHARGGAADLQVVLANLRSVEHGVERGNLVDLHWGHFEDLRRLVHGGQSQKVVVLLLSNEQYRDASRGLVVSGVLVENSVNSGVRLLTELEGTLLEVVFSVSVVGEGAEAELLGGHGHGCWESGT